jgi:hypothetical protein
MKFLHQQLSSCVPAGPDLPSGIDSQESSIISGVLDHVAPRPLSAPEPADGSLAAKDKIGVEFTEDMDCGLPFSFDVTLTLTSNTSKLVYTRDEVDIVCERRILVLSLANAVRAVKLSGKTVKVVLTGVRDTALDAIAEPIKWTFATPVVAVRDTPVEVT